MAPHRRCLAQARLLGVQFWTLACQDMIQTSPYTLTLRTTLLMDTLLVIVRTTTLHPKINLKNTSNKGVKMGGHACKVEDLKQVDTGLTTDNLISRATLRIS
jgi:hypothetical protein